MKISDIKIEPSLGPLVLATARDVDELEARLWITFPAGYREYVTRLGDGELSGFVRIYPPWRIDKELPDWRLDIDKYWFWQEEKDLLPRARAPECVYLGSSAQGDQLVFHPHRPDRLFVLPRHEERMFVAGSDLLSAVDWMCSSGKLTRRIKDRTFEPWDSRTWPAKDDKEVVDPEGESLDDIVELGRGWARRHRARKTLFDELPVGKGTASFIYEAIVLEGGDDLGDEEPGYLAVFRIDMPDGEVRIKNCQMDDDSSGCSDGDLTKRDKPD